MQDNPETLKAIAADLVAIRKNTAMIAKKILNPSSEAVVGLKMREAITLGKLKKVLSLAKTPNIAK